ncbi:MAG: hypothetical protein WA213_01815 [Terriglobales bacterium]
MPDDFANQNSPLRRKFRAEVPNVVLIPCSKSLPIRTDAIWFCGKFYRPRNLRSPLRVIAALNKLHFPGSNFLNDQFPIAWLNAKFVSQLYVVNKMFALESNPKSSRVAQIHVANILLVPFENVLDTFQW